MSEPPVSQISDVPALDLRIDELTLHGFESKDRYAIADAIERELARLFIAGGVPAALLDREWGKDNLHVNRLNAGEFYVPHDAPPNAVGVQVARAIHRGLGGATASAQPENRSTSTTTCVERENR